MNNLWATALESACTENERAGIIVITINIIIIIITVINIIIIITIVIVIVIVLCRCKTCKSLTQEEYLRIHGYVTWNQVFFCVSTYCLT